MPASIANSTRRKAVNGVSISGLILTVPWGSLARELKAFEKACDQRVEHLALIIVYIVTGACDLHRLDVRIAGAHRLQYRGWQKVRAAAANEQGRAIQRAYRRP